MELIKQRVHMNKCNCRECKKIVLTKDMNVPDAKPDVLSIMKNQGTVIIEESHYRDGKVWVTGELIYQLLYAVDGELAVNEITGSIPFEEQVMVSCANPEDEIKVTTNIEDLQSNLIHSRKIGVKAAVELVVTAESIFDGEGAVDIEDADSILTRKKTMDISKLVYCRRDTMTVKDQWKIPGTKDAIGQILYSDIRLGEINTRVEEDEIQVEGEANLFVIYLSESEQPEMDSFETTIPIEGKLECNGCSSGMIAQIVTDIYNKDLSVETDEDGERRIIDVNLILSFDVKIYGQEQLELLTDFYSTKKTCRPIFQNSYFENILMQNRSKVRVSGKIAANREHIPRQIWNVSGEVRIDHQENQEDGVLVQGAIDIRVLYLTGNEKIPLASCQAVLPFEQMIEADGLQENSKISLRGMMEQINGTVTGENEIEIKAVIGLELLATQPLEVPIISDYEMEEIDWKQRGKEPSMIGYVVKAGEELWDIAKSFYTTTDAIREINQMDSDDVCEGEMLLILKEIPEM